MNGSWPVLLFFLLLNDSRVFLIAAEVQGVFGCLLSFFCAWIESMRNVICHQAADNTFSTISYTLRVITYQACCLYKKTRQISTCRVFWLGISDSNTRMTESESVALPLGESPILRYQTQFYWRLRGLFYQTFPLLASILYTFFKIRQKKIYSPLFFLWGFAIIKSTCIIWSFSPCSLAILPKKLYSLATAIAAFVLALEFL